MSEVKSIAVIGAGTMGSGIALAAAMSGGGQGGIKAYQVDVSPEQLDRARAYHRKTLDRSVKKERLTRAEADGVAGRVSYHANLAEADLGGALPELI